MLATQLVNKFTRGEPGRLTVNRKQVGKWLLSHYRERGGLYRAYPASSLPVAAKLSRGYANFVARYGVTRWWDRTSVIQEAQELFSLPHHLPEFSRQLYCLRVVVPL